VAFNGDILRERAGQFMVLAEKQRATVPLMIAHRIAGTTHLFMGEIAEARAHFNQSIALYNPVQHRPLAARFGQDTRVTVLVWRAVASWVLGYPEKAIADIHHALKDAREFGQAATLMLALGHTTLTHILCGNYTTANVQANELVALADEKGALLWKAWGMSDQGSLLALSGKSAEAVQIISSGIAAIRSTGAQRWMPLYLSYLARAYAELGQFSDAWCSAGAAMTAVETTKETLCEAEVNRMAGDIALMSPKRDEAKAEAYFGRALAVARAQQAKSWELRAAVSMARLWREQGKRDEARELLAPVYGWFTEGFDTPDLKQAKALLDELA
jgi:predicted ATPase